MTAGAPLREQWILGPDPAHLTLPVDERRVRVLRRNATTHPQLAGLPDSFLALLRLAVSELATNAAVRHAHGLVQMLLEIQPGAWVGVHIVDQGDRSQTPQPSVASVDAVSGRGLALIAALCALKICPAEDCEGNHQLPGAAWCCSARLPWPEELGSET
jgi:anti-sigma regulatory factor (Ser/Thr protein kinase)